VVTIAGSLSEMVCRPPSTSRVTSAVVADLDLGGECACAPAKQCGQHLAGLVAVVVDGLLAEDDEVRAFFADNALRILATASGSTSRRS
jgi:hypothetical protein